MSVPNRQIGWSNESNLLWNISKQLERLTGVTFTSLSALAPTYKVYTALLTQSGGDAPGTWESGSGPVPVGVTFQIIDNDGGTCDFTNIGAPNNNVGTFFVSTGSVPNSWGTNNNGALDFNSGAPVVNVLENTIGNVWWTYGFGLYAINSSGLFTTNKVYVECENVFGAQWVVNLFEDYEESDLPNIIRIKNVNVTTGISTDGVDLGRIEIRVYN